MDKSTIYHNLAELAAESEASNTLNMLMERNIPDDVGEGAKTIMMLWNRTVNEFGNVAFCQMPRVVEIFLKSHGREIIRKDLYQELLLYMSELVSLRLVSPQALHTLLCKLQEIMKGDIIDDEQFNQFIGLTNSAEKMKRTKERKSRPTSNDPDQPTISSDIAHRKRSLPPNRIQPWRKARSTTVNYKEEIKSKTTSTDPDRGIANPIRSFPPAKEKKTILPTRIQPWREAKGKKVEFFNVKLKEEKKEE